MKYYIYSLRCPNSGEIRYIGMTGNVESRLNSHLSKSSHLNKFNWLGKLRKQGKEPIFEILEEVIGKINALRQEKYWINHYRAIGSLLINYTQNNKEKIKKLKEQGINVVDNGVVLLQTKVDIPTAKRVKRYCESQSPPITVAYFLRKLILDYFKTGLTDKQINEMYGGLHEYLNFKESDVIYTPISLNQISTGVFLLKFDKELSKFPSPNDELKDNKPIPNKYRIAQIDFALREIKILSINPELGLSEMGNVFYNLGSKINVKKK